mmetsp:Transcript_23456/g.54684  ORF Transcript_23456/g.54684 Transcript_23456/m.54684 type:complete len:883 (+) Transcript_23456:121-2769(+)
MAEQTAPQQWSFELGAVFGLHVLSYAEWRVRASAACLSKDFRRSLGQCSQLEEDQAEGLLGLSDSYWRFLCERLAAENRVYVPELQTGVGKKPPVGIAATWRELFLILFPLIAVGDERCLDNGEAYNTSEDAEVFKIRVMTRFRPSQSCASILQDDSVTLPLHQKVQLVRQQLACTSAEAVRIIMQERAKKVRAQADENKRIDPETGVFLPRLQASDNKENVAENVQRSGSNSTEIKQLGPIGECSVEEGETEEQIGDARCQILGVREDEAEVLAVTRQSGIRKFAYDRVFPEATEQLSVYELAARHLVVEFLNGTSASIICYGQTASGKTHTMFGPSWASMGAGKSDVDMRASGLVPRACSEVLDAVRLWRQRGEEVRLGVTYVELFGSEVSDLLREGRVVGQGLDGRYSAVRATDRVGHRYVLDGHTECVVDSLEQVEELLRIGDEAKRRAATAMNERSTRAHTVFILSLAAGPVSPGGPNRRSRFFFADLGGSEQLSKSKVDQETKAPVTVVGGEEHSRVTWAEYYQHRQRVQETQNINRGLFSLKRVIEALHRRSQMSREGVAASKLPYVPYQDSKLTMLLQEALGGSARTLVMATATMDVKHAAESVQTLRFAETCAQIQKRSEADQTAALQAALEQVARDISQLQAEIVKKERWEVRVVERRDVDTIAGEFGEEVEKVVRDEVVRTTVPVGAEKERQRLEHLLLRQSELQGLAGVSKDYRSMKPSAASDGGLGADFRHQRFSAKMKAKDFEDEVVLADAIRFLFRKAAVAQHAFGETEASMKRRLHQHEIPEGYFEVARKLREGWEDKTAAGQEKLPFGKVMMDRCQDWQSKFNTDPAARDSALLSLLSECKYAIGVPSQDPGASSSSQQPVAVAA